MEVTLSSFFIAILFVKTLNYLHAFINLNIQNESPCPNNDWVTYKDCSDIILQVHLQPLLPHCKQFEGRPILPGFYRPH